MPLINILQQQNNDKAHPSSQTTTEATTAARTTVATTECIDLLSSSDEESPDADEPILADLLPPSSPTHAKNDVNDENNDTFGAAASCQFQQEQDRLHASSSILAPHTSSSSSSSSSLLLATVNDNTDLRLCIVCGSTLDRIATYNGRLHHIKRCSAKHGVTAKDVRLDDDAELFVVDDHDNETNDDDTERGAVAASSSWNNPYRRTTEWHGGGDTTTKAATVATTTATTTTATAPSVNQLLMAGAKRAAKASLLWEKQKKLRTNRTKPSWSTFSVQHGAHCPSVKRIPNTDFCVDGFQYRPATSNYFLTHFHADHYGGITKAWTSGTIYCSQSTANLVHEQLGVDRSYLHPLPMHTPTVLETRNHQAVTVTLVHANHCPGAIMFLFEVGRRVILHVGDFRWNYEILSSEPPLKAYCRIPWTNDQSPKRIDDLYLDTTYCDAQYALPTQQQCIQETTDVAYQEVQRAQSSKRRLLMLFGAYTIGKEAIYMAVAKRLKMKVYVDRRRFKILNALEWTTAELALFTTKPNETILWVVPLGHINMKRMAGYQTIRMSGFSRDFDSVVGFRPTGWSMSSSSKKKGSIHRSDNDSVVKTTKKGKLTVHSVPYSEHSSFPELVECLECLNPRRIIPTVSVSKTQSQIDLLMKHWREKQADQL